MKHYRALLSVCCVIGAGMWATGCGGWASEPKASSAAEKTTAVTDLEASRGTEGTSSDTTAAQETEELKPVSLSAIETCCETPEIAECKVEAKSYYMVTEEESSWAPCLTLFDDGTFGFTCDLLSSYYPHGTYRVEGDRLIAVTDDGEYFYVFQEDNDKYIFLHEESLYPKLIDERIRTLITDKAVFALREPAKG